MHLLTLEEETLTKKGALHTAKEISGQPELWKQTSKNFYAASDAIKGFLNKAYSEADNIILTGAGTSAFIGLSLHGAFFRNTKIITRPIATTDIVSHPQDYFNDSQISLVISFARSGNSPESCAVLELADKFSKKCFHLIHKLVESTVGCYCYEQKHENSNSQCSTIVRLIQGPGINLMPSPARQYR